MQQKRIGLIDVDGKRFPNLALMRIAAYHKAKGDVVEWWWSDLVHYDVVYMSKIFSEAYSKDVSAPMNADKVIKGGTGYAITNINGVEIYDKPNAPKELRRLQRWCNNKIIFKSAPKFEDYWG